MVEVYNVSTTTPTRLGNISTRGLVQTADSVMIGGFVVANQSAKVIVRAIGPSLAQFNIPGVLHDPILFLYNDHGDLIFTNDNWQDTQKSDIEATPYAPTDPAESAILITLAQGSYTAIVRGVNGTTGVALVEVYELD
ncbi:MAG TPA: DVUA0089 family protein [Chthoniobacterales bacterium]